MEKTSNKNKMPVLIGLTLAILVALAIVFVMIFTPKKEEVEFKDIDYLGSSNGADSKKSTSKDDKQDFTFSLNNTSGDVEKVKVAFNAYRANNRGLMPRYRDGFEKFNDQYIRPSDMELSKRLRYCDFYEEDCGDMVLVGDKTWYVVNGYCVGSNEVDKAMDSISVYSGGECFVLHRESMLVEF